MEFNSIAFLLFFPTVVLLYFLFPHRLRWFWLLVVSYFFYMMWNVEYLILIFISTFVTYLSGLLMHKYRDRRKLFLVSSLFINLGILFFFKYFNFFNDSLSSLSTYFNLDWSFSRIDVLLPVGISFYTFQALSYSIDVYRGSIEPEKHFGKYALFVSFFPQLVAGPIEKSKDLLPQFNIKHKFDYDRIKEGLILMLWGFFKKVVIADRLAVLVNTVYNSPENHQGVALVVASVFFAFQIYCDFSSYTDIAIGAAKVMGFNLRTNFNRPYFSKSIPEFWRRWHISLGAWFKEYLYFPLGGNRKGKLRTNINILIVFVVSGLWHGASWNFVIWGGLHGIYQVIEITSSDYRNKMVERFNIDRSSVGHKFYRIALTFTLVVLAWVFFRANTLSDSVYIFKNLFVFNFWTIFDGSIFTLGLDKNEFIVAVFSLLILLSYEIYERKNNIFKDLNSFNIGIRWSFYTAAILGIIVFGIYGDYEKSQFIYFQF